MLLPPVRQLGEVGINKDLYPYQLSPQTWSDGRNVRFRKDGVTSITGSIPSALLDDYTTSLMYLGSFENPLWVTGHYTTVRTFDPLTGYKTNISRVSGGGYNTSADRRWTGEMFQGLGYFSNGWDYPQVWIPSPSVALPAIPLVNLSFPANTSPRIVRGYKNFLLAFNITEYVSLGASPDLTVVSHMPYRVQWSHPLAPGEVPTLSDWAFADPSRDCGEYDLAESSDPIIGYAPLGDFGVIYKENSTWGIQYIGGSKIMRFTRIFSSDGLYSQHCVQPFPRGHFVVTQDDVKVHTGTPGSAESVVENRLRKWLFKTMETTNRDFSYTVSFPREKEIWFCFCTTSSPVPDRAMMFNWETGAISIRDLPFSRHIQYGVIQNEPVVGLTWATA